MGIQTCRIENEPSCKNFVIKTTNITIGDKGWLLQGFDSADPAVHSNVLSSVVIL